MPVPSDLSKHPVVGFIAEPDFAAVLDLQVQWGPQEEARLLKMDRDTACRMLVAIRGWLFATAAEAVQQGCYNDDKILN